ncbi:hypothetical protein BX666DRAFT_2029713 [Dichotomocladium elegans]|nr:hypothetical protein BX666DRAFT_2029713 [Dichotomocladium elegans]
MAARDKTTTIPQQLEPFYTQLLAQSFPTSASAIDACRSLCAQYGFTVKQESSTHRNIYVYCSREGLADSVRNPKVNPKRKRPSKRCDCKWRVVLNENKETQMWRFRKSNNPEALTHNHPLMKPEEIERGWPKEVHDTICQLARGFLQTHEIRQRVQLLFPEITWNERRFYNRLSEERQKIRQESTTVRAQQLTTTWSKVCMAAAGCEELAEYAQTQLMQMLNTICTMAQIPVDSLGEPPVLSSEDEDDPISVPKGFAVVVIPEHTYLVKVHSQRTIQKKRKCMSPMLPPSQPFTQLPPHHSHAVSAPSTAVATATETTATATAPPPPPPPQMANYMVYPPPMHVPYYPVQEEDMVYPPLDTSSVTSSPSPASSSTPPPPAATFMTHATDRLIPQPAKRRRSSHMTFPYSLVYQQRPSSPMNGAGVHKCSAAHVPATTIPHGISPQHSPQRLSSQPVSVALTADPTRHNHQIPCYDNNYW